MAVVAAAYHLQLQRRVAIKYLTREVLDYPEVVERFLREARVAATIRGEHVVQVIDMGELEGGEPFMVLEYLQGVDLAQHIEDCGPTHVVDAVRYVLEACEALAEAHASKIVHRDLKPANLFLAKAPDRRRIVKVLDFGVSKIIDEPMTAATNMLGTVAYMSPEQLRASNSVDHRTDIWSLGIILYELLAGAPPFRGNSVIEVANAILKNEPKPLSALRAQVPIGLEAVIARCLETDPAARYPSVLELAMELAPFASQRDQESVTTIGNILRPSIAPPTTDAPIEVVVSSTRPLPVPSDAPSSVSLAPARAVRPTDRPALRGSSFGLRSPMAWLTALSVAAAVTVSARAIPFLLETEAPSPAAISPPSEVLLRVTATPGSARARVDDGPPLPLPLERSVRRDDREHTLVIEADGHASRTKTVQFTSDLVVAVTLTPQLEPSEGP